MSTLNTKARVMDLCFKLGWKPGDKLETQEGGATLSK
jgi:hypothetical protein